MFFAGVFALEFFAGAFAGCFFLVCENASGTEINESTSKIAVNVFFMSCASWRPDRHGLPSFRAFAFLTSPDSLVRFMALPR